MREFFGIGGYMREPEGYLSPAHLIFVSSLMLVMIAAAVAIGFVFRKKKQGGEAQGHRGCRDTHGFDRTV